MVPKNNESSPPGRNSNNFRFFNVFGHHLFCWFENLGLNGGNCPTPIFFSIVGAARLKKMRAVYSNSRNTTVEEFFFFFEKVPFLSTINCIVEKKNFQKIKIHYTINASCIKLSHLVMAWQKIQYGGAHNKEEEEVARFHRLRTGVKISYFCYIVASNL